VLPKCNQASDLTFISDVIDHVRRRRPHSASEPPLKIIALIESALAITNLSSICSASAELDGLIFAAEDFALDLNLTRTPSLAEFLYARSAIATAARAHNLGSTIDLVCTSFRGDEGRAALERECRDGRNLGFNGKQVIHPDQVDVVQRAFGPDEKEVKWALRVVRGDEEAQREGKGAWTLDGKMIDAPVVGKAKALVARAKHCGLLEEKA
jgi:citrate lyase subunit beta-like protein